MITYRFDLLVEGNKIAELTGIIKIGFGYIRNDYKRLILSHIGDGIAPEINNFLVEGSELKIYRQGGYDNATLDLIWAGEIETCNKIIDEKGIRTINIEAEHWGVLFLRQRYITANFGPDQEENIAWDIIDNTQTDTESGNFTLAQVDCGFTEGTLQATGITRSVQYTDQEILTGLQQLSDFLNVSNPNALRGFIITPDLTHNTYKVFNYYANLGTEQNVTYINPQLKTLGRMRSLRNFTNKLVATGSNNLKSIVYGTNTILNNSLKKRQQFVSFNNIDNQSDLDKAAAQQLAIMTNPAYVYSFTLRENDEFTGLYGIGDTIHLRFVDDTDFLDLTLDAIVFGIDLAYNDKGVETTTLTVAISRPVSLDLDKYEKLIKKIERADKRLINLEKA